MTDPEAPKKPSGGAMRAAGAGLELAGTLVACCLLGYWLDRKLGTSPWALLILAARCGRSPGGRTLQTAGRW